MNKLTKSQVEVLQAYQNNTEHTHSSKIASYLLSKGLLEPHFNNNHWTLKISEKGSKVLENSK